MSVLVRGGGEGVRYKSLTLVELKQQPSVEVHTEVKRRRHSVIQTCSLRACDMQVSIHTACRHF